MTRTRWGVRAGRGAPKSIAVDNGPEFASKAMEHWAYTNGVHLDFIRPGPPVENGYIESFDGKLRDECLNVEVLFSLADARRKLAIWLHDYNYHRPHSVLADRTPAESAATCSSRVSVVEGTGHVHESDSCRIHCTKTGVLL